MKLKFLSTLELLTKLNRERLNQEINYMSNNIPHDPTLSGRTLFEGELSVLKSRNVLNQAC